MLARDGDDACRRINRGFGRALRKQATQQDFSWDQAAAKYEELHLDAYQARRGHPFRAQRERVGKLRAARRAGGWRVTGTLADLGQRAVLRLNLTKLLRGVAPETRSSALSGRARGRPTNASIYCSSSPSAFTWSVMVFSRAAKSGRSRVS